MHAKTQWSCFDFSIYFFHRNISFLNFYKCKNTTNSHTMAVCLSSTTPEDLVFVRQSSTFARASFEVVMSTFTIVSLV